MSVRMRLTIVLETFNMAAKRKWTFSRANKDVHVLNIELPSVKDEQWILLQSDVHWDNPHCDRKLYEKHLKLAVQRDAPVFSVGDWFCAMQGKWDKRANKDSIRPEHNKGDYLDALVSTAATYLTPYKSVLCLQAQGNHETAILKRHETNLNERLVERLKVSAGKTPVQLGGYAGFVRIAITKQGKAQQSLVYHYFHGSGGGGPVTRGVISTNRMAVYLADADIVHSGHTHDSWQVPIARVKLDHFNNVVHRRQTHLRTPGYKEEFDLKGGWHIETGKPPKVIGGAWMRVFTNSDGDIDYEIHEAK